MRCSTGAHARRCSTIGRAQPEIELVSARSSSIVTCFLSPPHRSGRYRARPRPTAPVTSTPSSRAMKPCIPRHRSSPSPSPRAPAMASSSCSAWGAGRIDSRRALVGRGGARPGARADHARPVGIAAAPRPSRAGVARALAVALVLAVARGRHGASDLCPGAAVRRRLAALREHGRLDRPARCAGGARRRAHGLLHRHDLRLAQADPRVASAVGAAGLPCLRAHDRSSAAPPGPAVVRRAPGLGCSARAWRHRDWRSGSSVGIGPRSRGRHGGRLPRPRLASAASARSGCSSRRTPRPTTC